MTAQFAVFLSLAVRKPASLIARRLQFLSVPFEEHQKAVGRGTCLKTEKNGVQPPW
jgi:hypothetical protein